MSVHILVSLAMEAKNQNVENCIAKKVDLVGNRLRCWEGNSHWGLVQHMTMQTGHIPRAPRRPSISGEGSHSKTYLEEKRREKRRREIRAKASLSIGGWTPGRRGCR